jgi:hypothetical protein
VPADPTEAPTGRARRGLTKNQRIGLGLLLTLVGLLFLAVLFPTAPSALGYALPVGAAGILAVWIGGILMGIGSRS